MPTFTVADVKTENGSQLTPARIGQIFENTDAYALNGTLLQHTLPPDTAIKSPLCHSLLGAFWTSYSMHVPLRIQPDDVWLAITLSFADYTIHHAEAMRKSLVKHDGRNQMVVEIDEPFSTCNWVKNIDLFAAKIRANIRDDIVDWITPNFSTSTAQSRLIAHCTLVATLKPYFAYGVLSQCGIPSVTLDGTREDWDMLRGKCMRMGVLFPGDPVLDQWRCDLEKTLDHFISAYDGDVSRDWWNSAVSRDQSSGRDDIDGWALVFTPFVNGTRVSGKMKTSSVRALSICEVPVKFNARGTIHDVYMYAGAFMMQVNNGMVSASYDYMIAEMPAGTIENEIDLLDASVKPVVNAKASQQAHEIHAQSRVAIQVEAMGYVGSSDPRRTDMKTSDPRRTDMKTRFDGSVGVKTRFDGSVGVKVCDNCGHTPCDCSDECDECDECECECECECDESEGTRYPGHAHSLELTTHQRRRCDCDVCGKASILASYRCARCNYDVCFACMVRAGLDV